LIVHLTDCKGIGKVGPTENNPICSEINAAISISHLSHLLSVLVLYRLTLTVFGANQGKSFAYVSACLHIFSVSGIFLSAPYAESLYSLLSFSGYLFYTMGSSRNRERALIVQDTFKICSGFIFGLATTIRSNGILNGTIFLEDFVIAIYDILICGLSLKRIRTIFVAGSAGFLVGLGFIIPQWLAYNQYCRGISDLPGQALRPWCFKSFPSIYSFVQRHYWYVP